jgi:hypothetical protein
MKESIQETLKELGFREDQAGRCFCKGSLKIPFEALCGYSVETFVKMAHRRGWVMEEELRRVLHLQEGERPKNGGQRLTLRPCEDCGGGGWDKRTKSFCLSCLGSGVVWRRSANAQ